MDQTQGAFEATVITIIWASHPAGLCWTVPEVEWGPGCGDGWAQGAESCPQTDWGRGMQKEGAALTELSPFLL